jgi:hypothetical protein
MESGAGGFSGIVSSRVVGRFRESSGIIVLEGGVWILGILRLSDSSMLEFSRVLGDTELGSGFVNGVTSLKDGRSGAGFTDGWIVAAGGAEEGKTGVFTGSRVFAGIFV